VKRSGLLGACLAATLIAGAMLANDASATTSLILKVGGVAASDGSQASGALEMTCAKLAFGGTLTINAEPADKAVFNEDAGTDTCEGVRVRGEVRTIRLTSRGQFVVGTHLTYEVVTSGKCVYVISRLAGIFTIPGPTTATVSGTGKLAPRRSTAGCQEQISITGARAALYHGETVEPYSAET
jgi:hypothetical protein